MSTQILGEGDLNNDATVLPPTTPSGGAGGTILVQDEGVPLATAADTLNFVGAGVTASGAGTTKTITIPGSSSPLSAKGDIFGHSTVDARIPVGTDGQMLFSDSAQALGVKWANGSSSSLALSVLGIRKRWRMVTGANGNQGTQTPGGGLWTRTVAAISSNPPDWTTNWLSIGNSVEQSSTVVGSSVSYIAATGEFALSTRLTGSGGFFFVCRGGWDTKTATPRVFCGMMNNRALIGNVDPSTRTSCVGFGCDAADTQFTVMHNDSAGTCTKDVINGGVGFPTNTNQTDYYEFVLYAAPNQASLVSWGATNMMTGVTASGTVSADLPAANAVLAPYFWWSNGSTALACTVAWTLIYCEADY